MANIKDFIKKIGNSAVSLEEQQQALAKIEQTIIEAKQKRTEAIGKNAEMVVQALKTIEAKLEAKLEELNNTPAKQGIQGPAGKPGKDGKDGLNGRDGVNGKDGKDGKDGVDGNDGVSVVDAKIDFDGSLVIYLSNGSEIDAGQILSPDVAQNIIINSGGSGTSQTVTDTLVSLQNQIDTLTGIDGVLGDMAQQNANAVAIIGGTINGTTIGATTASTGRFTSVTNIGLTANRVPYSTTNGLQTDSANLTFNGTTLTANDITDSSLTSGRVTYAGTGGNLRDASNFTYDGTNLQAGAIQNTPIGSTTASTGSFTTLNSTGGALNGTIGATTPSTGTFTTITGQTEVLATTSNNLFPRSQTFNTNWTSGGANITVTDNAVTAPDSTTTAAIILPTTTNGLHRLLNPSGTLTAYSGVTYTASIYAKANGYRYLFVNAASALGASSVFDLQAGTVSTTSGTATITSAGNSWYRCTVTGTSTSNNAPSVYLQINNTYATGDQSFAGDGTSSIYFWGGQLEIGSSATPYVPTTTAGIWNIPSLSFASTAASRLGLQSDGSLFLQPAGTGAIQAQATTSTTAGGNARGANAVDWQTTRQAANQVASGSNSFLGGGSQNGASSFGGVVCGGGSNSSNTNAYATIVGGDANTASGERTFIGGGRSNTAAGYYNFIGGGFTNSGTSGSAVTTQSATMNGTTAVTLSGSNANIKVGQLITGTSIANFTYVAAISGTSLTLSQAASGSSTSTLSFFTPHGVVVGGGNNQATGAYSFIGGGGDAGTAANRNVASGDWSFVGGGRNNTASGIASTIGGGGFDGTSGIGNNATNTGATVVGGGSNNATGFYAVTGGRNNVADGNRSTVWGNDGTARSIRGIFVASACQNPIGGTGVSQSSLLILGKQTTDATATVLTSNGASASGDNQVILPNNSAYYFKIEVIAGVTGAGNTKAWELKGAIKRGANAASTTLVGAVTSTVIAADAGALAWTLTATADTTNGGIAVTATGQASTTIRWVARVITTEMTF